MEKKYRHLTANDVVVGKPLPFSVHDDSGTLLLRKGYVVESERQKTLLVNKKVYISSAAASAVSRSGTASTYEKPATISVFEWVDSHYQLLSDVYLHFDEPGAQSIKKIQILAERIQRLSEKNSDGLLAAVQLAQGKVYSHIKALHVGLLCEALGRRAELPRMQRLSTIAAGLTSDLAMWQLQEEIRSREEPLTDEQWQHIRSHPQRGVQLLTNAGVRDAVWLKAVEQHHERLNGSGYPGKLEGDQVHQSARILAVADTFSAMVRPRGDRAQRMPKEAMRDLFLSRGEEIDAMLAQLFIKELGMFPPGSAVRLISGEIGIVTGAGRNASSPDVEVVIDVNQNMLKRSVYRDTTQKNFNVSELIDRPAHPDLNKLLAQMWSGVPKR